MPTTLRAVHPNALEFDGRRIIVGRMSFDLLALVVASGEVKVRELNEAVWGASVGPRSRLDSMVHRLNGKLAAVGCALRIAVDGERIVLV